jgi:hypothetical protein
MVEDSEGKYEISGHYEFKVKMAYKTITTTNDGPTRLKFNDGSTVEFFFPTTKLTGVGSKHRRIVIDTPM